MSKAKPRGKPMSDTERKDAKKRFLISFKRSGNWSHSCERAGVEAKTIRNWMESDEKFALRFDEAQEKFVDALEMVAVQRAVDKSDTLLLALLKANRPAKFRENVKLDADVNQQTRVNLVFSQDEIGDMPNYAFAQKPQEVIPPDGSAEEETGESQ